ncbi:hypothetical protein QBC47DRAFT_161376 [Echria macrotheca]|uniref:C2H2-type domain-containing protein n=1 Tax=Echria macrotheca TaxID=438768 RepID=A0AAJ0BGK5_9PEZI|nr:hypothetical protein QBC47DRAFT_161376 [Echria macrotheca]
MHARDASGRRVSLLNDETTSQSCYQLSYRPAPPPLYHQSSSRSMSSSPNTPGLLRSDSYDSQMSNEPASPLTPGNDYVRSAYPVFNEARSPYEEYMDSTSMYAGVKRPGSFSHSRSASYDDDNTTTNPAGSERPGKRYPCRFRDSHGCEKTFTTSGHASRHSKIHTAEKAVPCTFPGCAKKFTRADNMKQHLDTHYKEKQRTSSSRPSVSSSDRKSSSSGKSSSSRTKVAPAPSTPTDAWDMRDILLPVIGRPGVERAHSGLDTLAMAAVYQER